MLGYQLVEQNLQHQCNQNKGVRLWLMLSSIQGSDGCWEEAVPEPGDYRVLWLLCHLPDGTSEIAWCGYLILATFLKHCLLWIPLSGSSYHLPYQFHHMPHVLFSIITLQPLVNHPPTAVSTPPPHAHIYLLLVSPLYWFH